MEDFGRELSNIFFDGFEILDYRTIKKFSEHSLIEFKNYSNYCSPSAANIDVYINGCQYKCTNLTENKTINKLIKNAEEWYFERCNDYQMALYDWLYNADSEEFKQYMEAKNHEFLENGTIFN